MSVCRRGIDLLGTMNIGLNILQDIQSSFFRTFIHLPGKKQGDIAGDNNDGGIDYLGDNLFTVEIPVYVLPDDRCGDSGRTYLFGCSGTGIRELMGL